jgi:hypothetical protein
VTQRLALWLGAGGALLSLVAMANLPYGFYTFNRVAVTAIAVLLSVIAVKYGASGWLFVLVPIAILWNPAFPVYLDRETWTPLNFVAAVALLSAGVLLSRRSGETALRTRVD